MHRAPAASLFVKRTRWHLWVVVVLALLGLVVSWLLAKNVTVGLAASEVLLCFSMSLLALRAWKHAPEGYLQWNSHHWHWSGVDGEHICRLQILLDFQSGLLVAMESPTKTTTYFWLESNPMDALNWSAVRRALIDGQRLSGRGNSVRESDHLAIDP